MTRPRKRSSLAAQKAHNVTVTRRHILLSGGAFVLTGCAQPLINSPPGLTPERTQDIFVLTNRTVSPDAHEAFEGRRSDAVFYRNYTISVPPDRKPGHFSFPRRNIDPKREFFVAQSKAYDGAAPFRADLNAQIARRPKGDRGVILFVHGYNVSYASAVFRAAQIATDFKMTEPMVAFSWPSAGRVSQYAYDRDSVLYARRALADAIKELAKSNAQSITILAHSMGGLLTMEALKRLALEGDRRTLDALNGVVLIDADIDVDVFRRQVEDVAPYGVELAVVASRRDSALKISSILTGGHPRVGATDDIGALRDMGVLVLDVTNAPGAGMLGHFAMLESPELLAIIASGQLLNDIVAGAPGQDVLIDGLTLTGNAALAIAYLPYTATGN